MAKAKPADRHSDIRFTTVINAAMAIISAFDEWRNDEAEMPKAADVHSQRLMPVISEKLDHTIRSKTNEVADSVGGTLLIVEEKARALMMRLDDVAYAFRKWVQDYSLALPSATPSGSPALYTAIENLRSQTKEESLPLPQPIEHLQKNSVGPAQIAKIYGWKLEDGSPDVEKVFEEAAKPGTHYDPKTWVHPAQRAIMADIHHQWMRREARPPLFPELLETGAHKRERPSLDYLIEQGAPVGQILRLYPEYDEQSVLEAAQVAGVELTGTKREIKPANEKVALQEKLAKEAAA